MMFITSPEKQPNWDPNLGLLGSRIYAEFFSFSYSLDLNHQLERLMPFKNKSELSTGPSISTPPAWSRLPHAPSGRCCGLPTGGQSCSPVVYLPETTCPFSTSNVHTVAVLFVEASVLTPAARMHQILSFFKKTSCMGGFPLSDVEFFLVRGVSTQMPVLRGVTPPPDHCNSCSLPPNPQLPNLFISFPFFSYSPYPNLQLFYSLIRLVVCLPSRRLSSPESG